MQLDTICRYLGKELQLVVPVHTLAGLLKLGLRHCELR